MKFEFSKNPQPKGTGSRKLYRFCAVSVPCSTIVAAQLYLRCRFWTSDEAWVPAWPQLALIGTSCPHLSASLRMRTEVPRGGGAWRPEKLVLVVRITCRILSGSVRFCPVLSWCFGVRGCDMGCGCGVVECQTPPSSSVARTERSGGVVGRYG